MQWVKYCNYKVSRFKYTQDGGVLTNEQRQFYEDNGYIVIRNNVSHALLDEVRYLINSFKLRFKFF